jgi:ubiquinone/menaquinone biosynthesis C-methylase UbiE
MADEYDAITDFWYSWLYARLHYLIARSLVSPPIQTRRLCVDIGCGTGLQSHLLTRLGYHVLGFDIARKLLQKANSKIPDSSENVGSVYSTFPFISDYGDKIASIIDAAPRHDPISPRFAQALAQELPLRSSCIDVVVSVGSTVSLIPDYQFAIQEIARILKPGGRYLIEVENRYNLDLVWAAVDSVFHLGIGYAQERTASLENLFRHRGQHAVIDFPFSAKSADINIPIRIFSISRLRKELEAYGLLTEEVHGIHSITNFIPSVKLDAPTPTTTMSRVATGLAWLEQRAGSWPVFRNLGCNALLIGRRL